MLTVTFEEVDSALSTIDAPLAAAEVHGGLCGALTASGGLSAEAWLEELSPASDATTDAQLRSRNLLETLFEETLSALNSPDMEFMPLLPDEESPLEPRVAALAGWCSGYLYGIGSSDLPPREALPAEVGEVLADFAEISRATMDADEPEESSEASYAELTEYVRAGVQLAYEELVAHRARPVRQ